MRTMEMQQSAKLTIEQREQKAQYFWTTAIVGFFVIQAIVWAVAITLTHRDPSHAVVPGYDAQALNWDETQKQKRASRALGWTSELEIDCRQDSLGRRSLRLKLVDENQQAVTGASLKVSIFHMGHITEAKSVTLVEGSAGIYQTRINFRYPGRWQIKGTAVRGDQLFLIDQREFVDQASNN